MLVCIIDILILLYLYSFLHYYYSDLFHCNSNVKMNINCVFLIVKDTVT